MEKNVKTKGLIFPEANRYEMRELTLDAPGPSDIVVRTLVSSISPGTERWTLRGLHLGTKFPCAPGYHRIGIVEECGEDVTFFQPGDVVYGSSGRVKDPEGCSSGAHVGLSVGDWKSYLLVSRARPSDRELEALVFTILAGVANRGIRVCDPTTAQSMLIIGAGILGVCAAQLAAYRGARAVLLEKDPERAAFVGAFMPTVVQLDEDGLEDKLKGIAPEGFDFLHDTVGHAPTTDRMVQLTRRRGTLLMQSQYFSVEKRAIDLDQIKCRELTIKTTVSTDTQDKMDTMENIRRGILNITSLITHRLDVADVLEGFKMLDTGKPFNLGIVFRWDTL
jgi:2-desacetyl-2-hydroxyethyl bacteriochlorophyllide A dehydrogenase